MNLFYHCISFHCLTSILHSSSVVSVKRMEMTFFLLHSGMNILGCWDLRFVLLEVFALLKLDQLFGGACQVSDSVFCDYGHVLNADAAEAGDVDAGLYGFYYAGF